MSPLEAFRGAGDEEIPEEERRIAGEKTRGVEDSSAMLSGSVRAQLFFCGAGQSLEGLALACSHSSFVIRPSTSSMHYYSHDLPLPPQYRDRSEPLHRAL